MQLTFFVFSPFPINKKIYYTLEKIKLHQKIHAIINELIAELPNSKEDLATIANIVVVQKLFPTPHKAHNLIGGWRSERKNFEQQIQQSTQYLEHIRRIKTHKIKSTTIINLHCTCYIMSLHDLHHHMVVSDSRKVVRVLMTEEYE